MRLFTLRLIALDVSQRNARKTSGALNTAVMEVYDTIIVGLLGGETAMIRVMLPPGERGT